MKLKIFKIRLSDDHLETDQDALNDFLGTVLVKKTTCQLINGKSDYWSIVVFYDQPEGERNSRNPDKIKYQADTALTENEKKIYEAFRTWRQSKATELGLPTYMICSNSELMALTKKRPTTIEGLLDIRGFGDQKIAKLGDDIIALLNSF